MNSKLYWAFAAVSLFAIVLSEYFYRQKLFDASQAFITKIQLGASSLLINFWAAYSDIALDAA